MNAWLRLQSTGGEKSYGVANSASLLVVYSALSAGLHFHHLRLADFVSPVALLEIAE